MKKLLCILLCLLLLAGCTDSGGNRDYSGKETHIDREINETLLVDAEIIRHEGEEGPKVFDADIVELTFDDVASFLASQQETIREVDPESGAIFCESGSIVTYYFPEDHTRPGSFSYERDNETMERLNAYPVYQSEDMQTVNPMSAFLQYFTEPVEFFFATEQEAQQQVLDALASLGIRDVVHHRTLYLEHSRLDALGREVARDENHYEVPLWDDWTEHDDAYMFEFFFSVGNSFCDYHSQRGPGGSILGSWILATVNELGVVSLWIMGPMQVTGAHKEPKTLLSAENALDMVIEAYENRTSPDMRTIEGVEFLYRKERTANGWRMEPAWAVTVKVVPQAGEAYTTKHVVAIDAITGELFRQAGQ